MSCPNCQTENPAGAKFCFNCGTKLALACPNCSTELPDGARFCFNCGHQIGAATAATAAKEPAAPALAQASPLPQPTPAVTAHLESFIPPELLKKLETARATGVMAGERRIVTILFCDVQGSTAAAGRLDPEDWAAIINGAFEQMIAPVYRYEGTLARLMGDGILAFFGAPIAHEDDPERAVHSGLEIVERMEPYRERIQKEWGVDVAVRVGVNTGLVVVGAVGSDLRMEYTALGDAINLAARMEQTAMPGTVQIAEPTYKYVAPLFVCENLGDLTVKGKEAPVTAYRVIAPRAQPGRQRGIEGLESPVVGRDAERHALSEAVRALGQGHGGIISISGEAGLGKSRLVADLHAHLPQSDMPLIWLEGRCLSYQTGTPYGPFIDLFSAHFGVRENGLNYEQLARRVAAVSPERVDEIAPFLATLLDISLSGSALDRVRYLEPPQMRGRVFEAVVTYLECLSRETAVVLVVDDLHWSDPTSQELLQAIMPLTDRTLLLTLLLFRPRRQEPSWRLHEIAARDFAHRYRAFFLRPLQPGNARQLVANLLHIEDLPESVRALILEKAEGNPFFVEEIIRSLLDAGLVVRQNGHWQATRDIVTISVPDTLTAVLSARLDRLDEEVRSVAQSAAVIGRDFRLATLEAVHATRRPLTDALTELVRRGLIVEESRIPERIYTFKHALTQETAYNSLLLSRRRELHLRVGGVLERMAPEAAGEIAHHFQSARQPERALPYLIEAADRAARAYATEEAIEGYREALSILEAVDDLAAARRTYEGLGNALSFANRVPEAIATFQEMKRVAEQHGDTPMQVSALNKLTYLSALRMGQFEQAESYMTASDRLARDAGDKAGLSELGLIRCMMCTAAADFEGVVQYMDETMALGRDLGVPEQIALALTHIASSKVFMLQFDEAMETFEEGLRLCREIGDRQHEAELLALTGPLCYVVQGNLAKARELAEQGLAMATEIGSSSAIADSCRNLGIIAHQQGEYERAIDYYQRCLDDSRAGGFPWMEAEALCYIGTVYLDISLDLMDRVVDFHHKAIAVLEQPGGAMLGASAWTEIGFCVHAAGKAERALAYFKQGLEIPTITMNLERPRMLAGMALAALELGRLEEARKSVTEARQYAEASLLLNLLPLVAYAEGMVAERENNLEAARDAFATASDRAKEMGLRPLQWKAAVGSARVMVRLGQGDDARKVRQEAERVVSEISTHFTDPELGDLFVTEARTMLGSVQSA